MADILGPRQAAVGRELTKLFEEVRRGPLDELAAYYDGAGAPKGEVTVEVTLNANDHRPLAVNGTPITAREVLTIE